MILQAHFQRTLALPMRDYILTISCPDTTGIVYNVSKFLFDQQCNILDSAQFGDESTNLFSCVCIFHCHLKAI